MLRSGTRKLLKSFKKYNLGTPKGGAYRKYLTEGLKRWRGRVGRKDLAHSFKKIADRH